MATVVAAGRRTRRRAAATAGSPVVDRPARAGRSDRGAVTAEAAAVLPLLVAVALALVWLVSLAAAQVRVVDAAREVARLAARGEPEATAVAHGRRVAPGGARFAVDHGGEQVRVVATAEVRGPGGLLAFLPGVEVSSDAVAVAEPR